MGSTGDPPVPVGDPPTGTSKAEPSRRLSLFAADALPIPSGESPDGTGQWPVLPKTQFPNTLLAFQAAAGRLPHRYRDHTQEMGPQADWNWLSQSTPCNFNFPKALGCGTSWRCANGAHSDNLRPHDEETGL